MCRHITYMTKTFLVFMTKAVSFTLLVCALAAGSGCEPPPPPVSPPHTFTGQVFITRDNGEALKLSLVTVKLIDAKDDIETRRKEVIQEACEKLAQEHLKLDQLWQIKRVYMAAEATVDKSRANGIGTEESEESWKEFLKASAEARPKERDRLLKAHDSMSTNAIGAVERYSLWMDRHRELQEANTDLVVESMMIQQEAYEALSAVPITRLGWTGATESTVTDPNGSFQLTIPAGKNCWLLAHAVVAKGRSEENYVWAFPVSAAYKHIQLHNKNTHPSLCEKEARTLLNRVNDLLAGRDPQQAPLEKRPN